MQTVTRSIKLARRHVGTRSVSALKRDAKKRERRADRVYTAALAMQIDPDAPNHCYMDDVRFARNGEPRCTSTTLEYAGCDTDGNTRPWEPTQCAYVVGHAASHCDGCVTWHNDDPPLAQSDEPRKREPRPLTGWDLW